MSKQIHGHGLQFPDTLVFKGHAAPVRIEADVYDLEVQGQIPDGLRGVYYRNSADHQYPPRLGNDLFINGDGMVHMVRIEDGHADLKTRYVRTQRFKAERAARRSLFGAYRNPFTDDPSVRGMDRGTANTSIAWHHGKLFALKEDSRPIQLDPLTLETLGSYDFNGALMSKTFTAHPKRDPVTGELIAFAYNVRGRSDCGVEVYTISPAGQIVRRESFEAPYPSMVHDFHVSRDYIAFTICPMVSDWARVERGEPYFHWDSRRSTHVGIFPRGAGVSAMRWYRCPEPVLQTHTFNAWDEGTVLHLDHFVTSSGWLSQFPDLHDPDAKERPPAAQRWSFDLSLPGESFAVRPLFAQIGEMPVIDPRFAMRRARHFYFGTSHPSLGPMLERGPKGPPFTCLGHFDEAEGRLDLYYAGPDSSPEEPCFVPKDSDSAEGDGWLLCVVGRRAEHRSDLVILDSRRLSDGPVATIRFPCRVHEGFHGTWVPAGELPAAGGKAGERARDQ